jgi:hypothetical protein
MLPVLLSRLQINDPVWNLLIERSGQNVIYAFTYYLDVVCENWKALVWPDADNCRIVMPLPCRRKFGMEIIYQPLFCQYLGIFSVDKLTIEQSEAFLRSMSHHYSYISAYQFNPSNFRLLQSLGCHFRELAFETRFTHWLNVTTDHVRVRECYSKDRLNNLKRAKKEAWKIVISTNIHPLIYLFVSNHAKKIGRINADAYNTLEALYNTMESKHAADLWYACKAGRIHAGILMIRNADKAIYLFNAADDVGRKGNARTFLLDEYGKRNAGVLQVIDFESPAVESIAAFYKSFGSEPMPFISIRKNQLSFPFRQLQDWRMRRVRTKRSLF